VAVGLAKVGGGRWRRSVNLDFFGGGRGGEVSWGFCLWREEGEGKVTRMNIGWLWWGLAVMVVVVVVVVVVVLVEE